MAMLRSDDVLVWTNSTTATFFPAIGPLPFVDTASVLWTLRCYGWADNFNVSNPNWPVEYRAAAQFSEDGLSWETPLQLGSGFLNPLSSSGSGEPDRWLYGDGFEDLTGPVVARYVRYGAMVRRPSGSLVVFGRFQLMIETRE